MSLRLGNFLKVPRALIQITRRAHSQLAEAYWNLGYETRAKAEAQKAVDLSGALSSEAKSLIKARYDRMSKDWKSANDLYASLWNISKESQYGLSLARNYIDADKPAEALAVLEKLKKEGSPCGSRTGAVRGSSRPGGTRK